MKWKCFKDEYPKINCGVIVKIDSDDYRNRCFYGYVFQPSNIYIILEITNIDAQDLDEMGWKILKDFDEEQLSWYYVYSFSENNQPERLSEKTSKDDAIV